MSKVRKPQPKYGWNEEIALQHSEDVVIHPISAPFPTNDAGEAYIVQETTSLGVEIQPIKDTPSGKGYTFMPPQPKEGHGSRLEAILKCEARAPMDSPTVQWGLEELQRTGARRVILDRDPSHSRWYTN